jgi:hypothetical protein
MPLGLWSRPQRGKWGIKWGRTRPGLENEPSPHLGPRFALAFSVWFWGFVFASPQQHTTHASPTHINKLTQDTGSSARTEARHTTTTREASWLEKVRKVKKLEKGSKRNRKVKSGRRDPGGGGEENNNFGKQTSKRPE